MGILSLRLPESLHNQRPASSPGEAGASMLSQLVASAVAEKAAALMTERYLEE